MAQGEGWSLCQRSEFLYNVQFKNKSRKPVGKTLKRTDRMYKPKSYA